MLLCVAHLCVTGFDLLTIIVFAVVFVAILLLCCAGGYCIYHCCCRRKRGETLPSIGRNFRVIVVTSTLTRRGFKEQTGQLVTKSRLRYSTSTALAGWLVWRDAHRVACLSCNSASASTREPARPDPADTHPSTVLRLSR